MNNFLPVLAASGPLLLLIVLLGLLVLAFEVWMFVDVINSKSLTSDERVIWALGMLLLHPFVAIAYYFVKRKS